MNLYLIGWNLATQHRLGAPSALRGMTDVFPLLDPDTLQTFTAGPMFAAFMHTAAGAARPRRYSYRTDGSLTFFEGCPVDGSGTYPAHDARALDERWATLHEELEGQFLAARLDARAMTLELVTDPLGVHQAFAARHGGGWAISNSAELLARLGLANDLDEGGAALFLADSWVGGDRTLLRGVSVLPGGQRWRWRGARNEPDRSTYFDLGVVARADRTARRAADVGELADRMGSMLTALGRAFAPLLCPITGGRDSRMMVGLMMRHGVRGDYFTSGDDASADVRIGTLIAERFGLSHRTVRTSPSALAAGWWRASRRLLLQTDGMVTLTHVKNALDEPTRLGALGVHLYGAGGEIARGLYSSEAVFLRPQSPERVRARLTRAITGRNPFLRPAVREEAARFVTSYTDEQLDRGVRPLDVPDLFAAGEIERRWAGNQFRQVMAQTDVFSPFLTRPYVRAAFAVPALARFTERVPAALLAHLSPELHALPYDKPWLPQSPAAFFFAHLPAKVAGWAWGRAARRLRPRPEAGARRDARALERARLLEGIRGELAAACLDQSGSPLWELVDRPRFERVLSDAAGPAERAAHHEELFDIATLFLYDATRSKAPATATAATPWE